MKEKLLLILVIVFTTNLYCYSQGAWTQKADFPGIRRVGAVCFSIGTKGYLGTGITGPQTMYYKDFWEWDQATNTWTQKADFAGTARGWAAGFSIGNKGYIGIGSDSIYNNGGLKDFWEWDGDTSSSTYNTWKQKQNFIGQLCGAVGFSIGTKGYFATGNFCNVGLDTLYEYNTLSDTWSTKSNLPVYIGCCAVGFSIGIMGYIATGTSDSSFWEWNQTSNSWTQKAKFIGSLRSCAAGFSIGTKGYLGTGCWGSAYYQDFYEWDQKTNIWTQKAKFPDGFGRACGCSFSIGSKGYFGLGEVNPGIYKRTFWEFDPNGHAGINETVIENSISVYPNPSNGKINIQSDKYKIQNVKIYTTIGEKICETKNCSFDISDQPNGVYFVHITSKEGTAVKKIIINK